MPPLPPSFPDQAARPRHHRTSPHLTAQRPRARTSAVSNPARAASHRTALADSPPIGAKLNKERNGIDFDSNHETQAIINIWKPKTLMECVIGSRSTSSPAWSTYKTAPVDPSHLFSPPAATPFHCTLSLPDQTPRMRRPTAAGGAPHRSCDLAKNQRRGLTAMTSPRCHPRPQLV
jgi:hypothetical protein